MKRFSKTLALLLSLVLALGLGGCNSGDLSWVYSMDGTTMPAGVYINYLISAYSEGVSELMEQEEADNALAGITMTYSAYYDMTASQILREELGGGTVADWMNERAQLYAVRYFAAEQMFSDLGLELGDDALADIANDVDVWMSYYGELYETNGVAESSVRLTFENEQKQSALFEHFYGPGGEYEVSDAKLKEMMAEHYALGQSLSFSKATDRDNVDDGSTVEERNERVRAGAEEYLQRLKDGEQFEALVFEREMEVAIENGQETDGITQADPGELNFVIGTDSDYVSYYGQEFVDAVFGAGVGEPELVETTTNFYIINRLDITADEDLFEEQRDNILHNHSYETFTDMLDELGATLNLSVNQKAVDKYKANWLKLDIG